MNQINIVSKQELQAQLIPKHALDIYEEEHWNNMMAMGYKIMKLESDLTKKHNVFFEKHLKDHR